MVNAPTAESGTLFSHPPLQHIQTLGQLDGKVTNYTSNEVKTFLINVPLQFDRSVRLQC